MNTIDRLVVMTKSSQVLVQDLLNAKEYNLAWRVYALNMKTVMHTLHRMHVDKRTRKLMLQHAKLAEDLVVAEFALDLDKNL